MTMLLLFLEDAMLLRLITNRVELRRPGKVGKRSSRWCLAYRCRWAWLVDAETEQFAKGEVGTRGRNEGEGGRHEILKRAKSESGYLVLALRTPQCAD